MPNPSNSSLLRVFLCHASGDKPLVRKIYGWLQSIGTKPWLDEEDLLPGQDWDEEIRRVMRQMDIILICLSRAAATKGAFGKCEEFW